MATGTAATTARKYHSDQLHYISCAISYADGTGKVYTVGKIPAGSLINKAASGVHVTTAFDSGTNKQIDIGFIGSTTDDDYWGTDMSLASATFVPLDEAVGGYYITEDRTVTATLDLTGTAATAGAGYVIIAYAVVNRSL